MPLPIPNLDDRRFDDLVADARLRLSKHLPELTQIAPGDPAHAMIDVFAYLTETILFRANLIPERQRRVILNMLQIPIRSAIAAKGVVCVDSSFRHASLPALIKDGAQLSAGQQNFLGLGECQATPLSLSVSIKKALDSHALSDMGLTHFDLHEQYGLKNGEVPQAFEPKHFVLGTETLSLVDSLDHFFYLALSLPKTLKTARTSLRDKFAGITLNIAIAPASDLEEESLAGESSASTKPRRLVWELLSKDEDGNLLNLPLELVADSSRGGRQCGVVRLRLPTNADLFKDLAPTDPMFAGLGDEPPDLPEGISSDRIAFWLRLSCPDEAEFSLGYLDVNGLEISGQGMKVDRIVGIGTGMPDQSIQLPDTSIDASSLVLQVEEEGAWSTWQAVDFLVGLGSDARVFHLDAHAGLISFGDGLEGGKRPPEGMRIRVAIYRFGGGSQGNLPAHSIKDITPGTRLTVRHEWPTQGGVDAESITQAEKRIPQFLSHRNRAVTKQDFQTLAQNNPIRPVARAEILEGFIPGSTIEAARSSVPGAVSVFILPPRTPALSQTPKPNKGMLADVFDYLKQRILLGTELYVLSPQFIPLALSVNVKVLDAETEQETLQAVQKRMVEFLWPVAPGGIRAEGWPFGGSVGSNECEAQVARVEGVRSVSGLSLFQKTSKGWKRLPQGGELNLEKYQLPELVGIHVGTASSEEPAFPDGITSTSSDKRHVPAPVIPEVC